jgi:transposase
VSVSSAIRWLDRLKKQGDVAAKRQGGDRKPGRIEAEASFLLGEVAETPDITLVELQEKLQARGVSTGIGTLWRSSFANFAFGHGPRARLPPPLFN